MENVHINNEMTRKPIFLAVAQYFQNTSELLEGHNEMMRFECVTFFSRADSQRVLFRSANHMGAGQTQQQFQLVAQFAIEIFRISQIVSRSLINGNLQGYEDSTAA